MLMEKFKSKERGGEKRGLALPCSAALELHQYAEIISLLLSYPAQCLRSP